MLHRISEKYQKVSRLNSNDKVDYSIDYIDIDEANEILYVTLKNLLSHELLRDRIKFHRSIMHAEDISVLFTAQEDETNLQLIFSNNIKESLDFLKGINAFSIDSYSKALQYLNSKKVVEEKSREPHIPSHTIQTSISNSNCLFSNESLSTTPPTPPSDHKNFRM